ncbi:amino acid ABC transporter permease [Microbacteriaceae bacterium VKM Ac-2854]|nr:amino acid ABC transporter permease [Microbacteriaceae bacterium VKM Ac-2854]
MNAHSTSAIDVSTARHRRRPGQWIASVIVLAIAAGILWTFAGNPTVEWDLIAKYLFFPNIMSGLVTTLWLTVASMVIGIIGGVLLAACRLSNNLLLRGAADVYVWFFRGTPLLVQLIFWYNIAIFIPRIEIGIPFGGPTFVSESTNDVVTPLLAALLGLALNEAAYMCEVVRGGLISVSPGQAEAAQSLGLSSRQTFAQIVLPQAMRSIVPPTGNQVISMLKGTSLVSVMAVYDLFYSAQAIYTNNGKIIPLLIVACIWYLVATSVLYVIQSRLEKRFGRGVSRAKPAKRGTKKDAALTSVDRPATTRTEGGSL